MSFQVGIGSLGGTVLFQVALCTPLWTMDMIKIKREAVNSFKATFYKRFVGNINNRGRKGQPDQLFKTFNNNHINVNYKVEVCLEMLLDTKMIYEKNSITSDLPKGLMNLQIFHMVYVWITKR